jgi:hypothetical protein
MPQNASRIALTIVRANSRDIRSRLSVSCWKKVAGSVAERPLVASYYWRNITAGFSHSTLFSRTSRSSIRAVIVIA